MLVWIVQEVCLHQYIALQQGESRHVCAHVNAAYSDKNCGLPLQWKRLCWLPIQHGDWEEHAPHLKALKT